MKRLTIVVQFSFQQQALIQLDAKFELRLFSKVLEVCGIKLQNGC